MLKVSELIAAVQKNCDISDALHASDYSLCTYLLKMREYYRWEHELPYFHTVPQDDLGNWLSARERYWDTIDASPPSTVPLAQATVDPFDNDAINSSLVPAGLVYSAGYGRFHKPLFFLGQLTRVERRDDLTIIFSSCEYARELAAPPAMLQGQTIFVREESAQRFIFEKIEESQLQKQDNAMRRAMQCYNFGSDPQAALTRMTKNETAIMVQHEIGESVAGKILGPDWSPMLASLARTKAELIARAIRDHLADCLVTLPALIEQGQAASLHFYFANLDGLRKHLFAPLLAAYRQWLDAGDLAPLRELAKIDGERWRKNAAGFVHIYRNEPQALRAAIEALLPES